MMRNIVKIILLAALALAIVGSTSEAGIRKVAKRVNMISFYGGYSTATGSYDSFGLTSWAEFFGVPGSSPSLDADELYQSTFHFGFDYGQIRNNQMLYMVGFRYTRAKTEDSILVEFPGETWTATGLNDVYSIHLYELEANFNYFLVDPTETVLAPFIGFGGKAGLMNFSTDLYDVNSGLDYADENELKFTLNLNFGADLKLWEAPSGMSYFALSSVNSWDVLASGNRPRYLNIGGALKYYFRP